MAEQYLREPDWVAQRLFEARLAEHASARDEMISAISNQHLALTFGSASIVGVFVVGFLQWKQSIAPVIFFAVLPLSAWVLSMWLAEVVRMLRAVAFCREQATIINDSLGMDAIDHPPLRWEVWRDEEEYRTMTWPYVSVVGVLSGAYLTGAVLGLVTANWSTCWTLFATAVATLGFGATLGPAYGAYTRWRSPQSKVGMTRFAWLPHWPRHSAPDGD